MDSSICESDANLLRGKERKGTVTYRELGGRMGVNRIARLGAGLVVCVFLGAGLVACGTTNSSSSASQKVTTIRVGTEGTYAPYTYLNDSNQIDGYDIQVDKAIDEKLPDYKFQFVTTKWDSMFSSLDAGKIDMVANQISKNSDREAKYLFSSTPYSWSSSAIIFKKGRTDITSIKDLYGKTVDAGLTSANTTWLEDYNAKHGNKIKIRSTDGDVSKMLQDIVNGRADATLNSPVTTELIAKQQNLDVSWVTWNDQGITPEYLLFSKNALGRKLKKETDPIIKEVLKDGTLSKLSKK